jgi:23S rRNA pseudouridine2605 synthase
MPENRPRQVPRMCESIGHPVMKLLRVAFADIGIEGVPPGETRELTDQEIAELQKLAGVSRRKRPRTLGRRKQERE